MSSPSLLPVVVRDLSVTFRDTHALVGIDLVAPPGRRIGLVGENGSGKSTLLRAVAGRLPSRARVRGTVETPPEVVMLGQEPPFADEATVGQVRASMLSPLRRAVADVERLAERLEDPEVADLYAERLEFALAHDAWDAERRARLAAHRLGLGALDDGRRIDSLSGGQRARLALAALMTRRPSCLLLDEPTNHLDDDAIGLLGEFLGSLDGVVLLASHDRVLLDDVCTDLLDLDPNALGTDGEGGRLVGGGAHEEGVWSAYVERRAATRRRWEQTYQEQQEELGRLRAATRIGTSAIAHNRGPRDNDRFIYGFKGGNVEQALARRKRDAVRRLETAERSQVGKPPRPLVLRATLTREATGGRIALLDQVVVDGRLRLPRLDLAAGEHLLVSGVNGSGKSTLLGVLAGRVAVDSGVVQVGAQRVVELPQEVRFTDPARSAQRTYDVAVGEDAPELGELGLLSARDRGRAVGLLSAGQRRRLGLAIAVSARPDLLLLDEPTNHLSLTLAGELEEAMQATPGAVVVASHDRWLRRRWQGREVDLVPAWSMLEE